MIRQRFPRCQVGSPDEPDRTIVMMAHDSAPRPFSLSGPGAGFIGTTAAERYGPFVLVLSRDYPGQEYRIVELTPSRNWQYPWEAVHMRATQIMNQWNANRPPKANRPEWRITNAPDPGPQRKREGSSRKCRKEHVPK